MQNHEREKSQLIKGSIVAIVVFLLGVYLKYISDTSLADYFLVVTTVFIFPVILIALDNYEKTIPKFNFISHIIVTIMIGVALSLTSFKDITTYCDDGISSACRLTTFGVFSIYFIIIALGVGISNYDKDKSYFKTKKDLKEAIEYNSELQKENKLLKKKLDSKSNPIKDERID